MIFYMFSFYKNTDILITDKRSVISCKLEKKKIAVLIDSYTRVTSNSIKAVY